MENLEISAKTVEEAIQRALDQIGVTREQVEVTILSEGRPGILGIGAEQARIRVRLLEPAPGNEDDLAEEAKSILETLLSEMGIMATVVSSISPLVVKGEEEEATAPITFEIKGEDLGILIGRRGQTLSSLQHIIRLIMAHRRKAWVPIIIDVEGYRQRRYEALQALARRVAEQVKAKGASIALSPMPAYERRIIHLTLADRNDVSTESDGMGGMRKVVIQPKKK